jgi:hypothetical protein
MSEGLLTRTRRAFEFGRHIPPAKIARRLELGLKRRVRDRFPTTASKPLALRLVAHAPLPLFAPRPGLDRSGDGDLILRAVGRELPVDPSGVVWARMGDDAGDQLPAMMLHYMEYLEAADDALFQTLVGDWIAAVNGGAISGHRGGVKVGHLC